MAVCANPECNKEFTQYNSLQKFCGWSCKVAVKGLPPKKQPNPKKNKARKNYRISQVSKKKKIENLKYSVLRVEFLGKPENKICFIDGCQKEANTIEHTKGRKGYADDWARDNKIGLTIDVRFWKPCCLEHNLELENNPELSKKYQLSKLHNGKKI